MAKKQTIILTHGNTTPSAELIQLGEVLVQHASTKTETGLHTVTEIDGEKTVVTIPSKDWVASEIAKVDAGGYGISWNDDIDISEYELWNM